MSVYLRLLHGKNHPEECLTDWGFSGPVLGPFEAVQVLYKDSVRCAPPKGEAGEPFVFGFYKDMLVYEEKYYGFFEIVDGKDLPRLRMVA